MIAAASLGSEAFKRDYGTRLAYAAGAMYKGIASKELVVAMGRARLLSFFGAGGLSLPDVRTALEYIQSQLRDGEPYGMNLLHNPERPELEDRTVELYLEQGVRNIEAAAFTRMTHALVHYRVKGLGVTPDSTTAKPRRILAKVSRPEIARLFLSPAPQDVVAQLLREGLVTAEEARLSQSIPMADDICVEADSGGHTDQGVASVLLPAIMLLRDDAMREFGYRESVRVGAAGGIGVPHAAAAVFVMGADFVLTGSINQCTVESGTSDAVKDLLEEMEVQDTAYAPAGDMFEVGARVQVARRGLFFPARANKLYELYLRHNSIEEIDNKTRLQIEERYFRRSFNDVWRETLAHYAQTFPKKIADIERNSKQRMALIFKWYFVHTTRLALRGDISQKVDFQIHCGPALGAFNAWVKGSSLESWRNRHVAEIGISLMEETARLLDDRFKAFAT